MAEQQGEQQPTPARTLSRATQYTPVDTPPAMPNDSVDTRPSRRTILGVLRERRIAALVLLALAIRVVVMPFTLHFDAYSIYSRAAEAAYDGQWFGFTSQFLIQGMHNVWLALMRPLLPDSADIWSPTASVIGVGAGLDDYARFMAYDHLYRVIFLMKVPYVIADLACAWVIGLLVPQRQRLFAMSFWLLNPLVIFSSSIWGRHDSVAILMVLLSLLVARRATDLSRVVALGLLGAATIARFFPAVIVPLFLLAFRRNTRQLLTFVGLLGGMVALVELAAIATSGKSAILTVLSSYQHVEYWFDAGLLLRVDDWLALFPIFWLLGLFWLLERGVDVEEYPVFAAAAFLLVFAFTFFHPHYAVWLVPFLAVVIPASPVAGRLVLYHALQIVCVFAYSMQWGAWSSWELLRPLLGDRVASLPDPYEAITGQVAPRVFFGTVRAALTATSLWMLWLILPRPIVRSRATATVPATPAVEERSAA